MISKIAKKKLTANVPKPMAGMVCPLANFFNGTEEMAGIFFKYWQLKLSIFANQKTIAIPRSKKNELAMQRAKCSTRKREGLVSNKRECC